MVLEHSQLSGLIFFLFACDNSSVTFIKITELLIFEMLY